MEHIAKMKRLVYLGLRGNKISDAALAHLAQTTRLTELHLGETGITERGQGSSPRLATTKTVAVRHAHH
ncbi:MAG: hypothetical protein Ct9H300mP32_2020 [Verrucomicrobiota bacterium]|nr:MAG: hypothetical protein Ct9H300mP32_2020 [Verrucomicrobiota bacterium]